MVVHTLQQRDNNVTLLWKSWQFSRICAKIAYGFRKKIFLVIDKPKRQYCCCGRKYVRSVITVVLNNWTFRGHHWGEFYIKTLLWSHTNSSWFRSWMRFCFAKWAYNRLTEDVDFGKKNFIFSDAAHFDRGGYVNKQNSCIWSTKISTHTLKTQHKHNTSVFGADLGLEA